MGNRRLMQNNGFPVDDIEELLEGLENEGKTVMIIAFDGKFEGVIAVADTVRIIPRKPWQNWTDLA